jgi:ATP-dependent DNA ligase
MGRNLHWSIIATSDQHPAECRHLTWTDDGLLRHTVFVGLREDKLAKDVRREASARPK